MLPSGSGSTNTFHRHRRSDRLGLSLHAGALAALLLGGDADAARHPGGGGWRRHPSSSPPPAAAAVAAAGGGPRRYAFARRSGLRSVRPQADAWVDRIGGGPREDLPATDAADFSNKLDETSLTGYRLARRLGWSRDDALDIVQDAALRAWRYRHTRKGPFRPWFLSIVYREAHRRGRRWLTVPLFWRENDEQAPSAAPLTGEMGRYLAMLPRRQRVALWLRFGADLPSSEVGRVMGISERAAIQLVWRARQTLRHQMVGAEEGLR